MCSGSVKHLLTQVCADRVHGLLADFIERMEYMYNDTARSNGCYMASAAGFDSVPADLGTIFTAQQFQAPAVPCSVEAIIQVSAPAGHKIHFATW